MTDSTPPLSTDLTREPAGPWWRDAVVYQVYVRSFADSDGDGLGDLPGIRARLGYLRDLGVDAIWLNPFYPSPQVDAGYDVSDYRDVDARFGSLADFDALVADAHALGLRVVVDVVPNHCSDQHPWFQEALRAGPGSPERERFVFRDGRGQDGELPPNNWLATFGGLAWTRVVADDGTPEQWYLHLFTREQPDWNWENQDVRSDFERTLRFWLDRGVDGFRIDVAHGLAKAEGLPDALDKQRLRIGERERLPKLPYWDQPAVHEIFRSWHKVLAGYEGERMTVGEVWLDDAAALARYVRPDELSQAFNFRFLFAPWGADSFRRVIDSSLHEVSLVGASATWVLSNHDVVRHPTRYGSLARARAATLLMLALPGSAYVYQGEELGLPEVLDLPEECLQDPAWERSGHRYRGRDGCRVPLPWSGSAPPFGFSPDGTATWLPQPAGWGSLTALRQAADRGSTLSFYRRALDARRDLRELHGSGLTWLPTESPDVLAFARGASFVCALNAGTSPARLPDDARVIVSSARIDGQVLPPDTTAWYRTG